MGSRATLEAASNALPGQYNNHAEELLALPEKLLWHQKSASRLLALASRPAVNDSLAELTAETQSEVDRARKRLERSVGNSKQTNDSVNGASQAFLSFVCDMLVAVKVMPADTTPSDLKLSGDLLRSEKLKGSDIPRALRQACRAHLPSAKDHRDWTQLGVEQLLSKTGTNITELEQSVKSLTDLMFSAMVAKRQAPDLDTSSARVGDNDSDGKVSDDDDDDNNGSNGVRVDWQASSESLALLYVGKKTLGTIDMDAKARLEEVCRLLIRHVIYTPHANDAELMDISTTLIEPIREQFPSGAMHFEERAQITRFAQAVHPLPITPRMAFCQLTFQAMIQDIKDRGPVVIIGQLLGTHIPWDQLHSIAFDTNMTVALYEYFDFVTSLSTTRGLSRAVVWITLASLCELSSVVKPGPWSIELERIDEELRQGQQVWCDLERMSYLWLHVVVSPTGSETPEYFDSYEPDWPASSFMRTMKNGYEWSSLAELLYHCQRRLNTLETSTIINLSHGHRDSHLLIWLMPSPDEGGELLELCWVINPGKVSFCYSGFVLSSKCIRPRYGDADAPEFMMDDEESDLITRDHWGQTLSIIH